MTTARRSVLLASASTAGTIAAVRQLAAHGFDVGVVASRRFSAAAWSRCAARSYNAPPESQGEEFLMRLLEIGAKEPDHILLPTSDETAWLYAESDLIKQCYQTYLPPLVCFQRILDKKLFADAARAAGVPILPCWDPSDSNELGTLARSLSYPVLIKPRTHVHRLHNNKGMVARNAHELVQRYEQFIAVEREHEIANPLMPRARRPLIQQFVKIANEGVCSITGFLDHTGELYVTRRSTKVFLRSHPVGTGICFESLPPDPSLSDAVRRLCAELGYFGIFEVEFVRFNDSWAVIDFNPRLFHQIGLDIYRGMPLPLLASLAAAGDRDSLRAAVRMAQTENDGPLPVFCDSFTLQMILAARKLTKRISSTEFAYWRDWSQRNAGRCVDVAADKNDPIPRIVHACSEMGLGLLALPRFLRLTPRTSPTSARTALGIGS